MAKLRFQAGETKREGQDFREKLDLDCKEYLELVIEDRSQGYRVYNAAKDRSAIISNYFPMHVGEGIDTESILLTGGIIVGPKPRRVLRRLEKMTGIKLIEKEHD